MVKQYKVPASVKKAMIYQLTTVREMFSDQYRNNPKRAIVRKGDIKDINKGLALMRKGEWDKVLNFRDNLDTEPRELWPKVLTDMEYDGKYLVKSASKKTTTKKVRRQRKTAKPAGKIKGKKPVYRKKRPSPQLSATSVKIGTLRKGGDGKMYICKGYKRQGKTIKRWVKA